MLWRLLERPCTLALLVGSQLAVMMYLSLGGFQSLSALFGREQGPTFDSSYPQDVYTNLSHLPGGPVATGGPLAPQALPYCPEWSPLLVGPVSVSFSPVPSVAAIVEWNPPVEPGGRYRPAGYEPRSQTAIIVPHRAREHHLCLLLYHLHSFLQRQKLAYAIYDIHQAGNGTLNRANLLNIVREALRDEEWDCLFLHDVDLLPENDHNLYVCDPRGSHYVAVAMNKFGYSLPYSQYFRGLSALTPDQYLKMNGFPNEYWGWGGENDDIITRMRLAVMKISRPSTCVGH